MCWPMAGKEPRLIEFKKDYKEEGAGIAASSLCF